MSLDRCLSKTEWTGKISKFASKGPKAIRGKTISKTTISSPWNLLVRFEFFLNNSEMEGDETIYSQKESIIIECDCYSIYKPEDMKTMARDLKSIVLETFISNKFIEDEDIENTSNLIQDVLRKTSLSYSLDINKTGKYFTNTMNGIPENKFYYCLNCSCKMKDCDPYTYISEKIKTNGSFYIETNKAYNNRFFEDECPDMIYMNIWNIDNCGKPKQEKKVLLPVLKSGKRNNEFDDVVEMLDGSCFDDLEAKYQKPLVFF